MIRSWDCIGCFSFPQKGKRIGLVFSPGVDVDTGSLQVAALWWLAGSSQQSQRGGTSALRLGEGKGRTVLCLALFFFLTASRGSMFESHTPDETRQLRPREFLCEVIAWKETLLDHLLTLPGPPGSLPFLKMPLLDSLEYSLCLVFGLWLNLTVCTNI